MKKPKIQFVTAQEAFESAVGMAKTRRWEIYSPKLKSVAKSESMGVLVATDLHYGVVVDGSEVPGNGVDSLALSRRTAFLAARSVDYKSHKTRGARILLGGDIIEGEIHGRGTAEPLAQQIFNAQHCLHHLINLHVKAFGSVVVDCATGNHDRYPMRDMGRVVDQKWNSLSTLIYAWLAGLHKDNPNVKFNIPRTPYTVWKSPGGAVCVLTHGDTVYEISNPANAISYGKVRSKTSGLSAITRKTHGGDVELVVLGHHHSPVVFCVDDFTVAINGCLSGISSYSQSLGYHIGKPKQLIFEQTTEHVFGHPEFCDVSIGDNMKEMDKIVPPVPKIAT